MLKHYGSVDSWSLDPLAVYGDGALLIGQQTGYDVEQGCFSAAAGAYYRHEFSVGYRYGDVGQGDHISGEFFSPIEFGDVVDF